MSITFRVDDVVPAASPPSVELASARFPSALVLGVPGDMQLIRPPNAESLGTPTDPRGIHPLLGAVHLAFSEHRPLVLSPDVIWITIAQGIAQHVRLHAEELRGRLVKHQGRKELRVTARSWATPQDWQKIVAKFRVAIADEIGDGQARQFMCDFSTTTDIERTASEIVFMDVFASYYDYTLVCICGIPEITLLGTPADWLAIRERIDAMAELGLGFWTASLVPMADQWLRAAEGSPDPQFWQSIYKPRHAYGWDRIAGWVARLFPYLASQGRFTRRNPLLEYRIGDEPASKDQFSVTGIIATDAPSGISSVRCKLEDALTHATERVLLEGGLVGVTCDHAGRLEARCGWLVRREPITMRAVIERLRDTLGAVLSPARPVAEPAARTSPFEATELKELFDEIDEVVLFDGDRRWTVARPRAGDYITVRSRAWQGERHALRVVDLHDGTFLARLTSYQDDAAWVRMRADRMVAEPVIEKRLPPKPPRYVPTSKEDGATLPVVGQSLAQILDRALDAAGAKESLARTTAH
jgi:hypothetical protein